ncbi:MAG: hypothetical protein R2792_02265 [Saprospiraceae bacterium]
MKRFRLLSLLLFTFHFGIAQEVLPIWARTDTTEGNAALGKLPILLLDSFQNIILCGETYNAGPLIGFFVVKYDENGNRLWEKRYDTSAQDAIKSAVTDASGAVYVGGDSKHEITQKAQFIVFKYGVNGDSLWQYRYSDDPNIVTGLNSILFTPDNNLILLGRFSNNSIPNSGLLAVALDTLGNKLWEAEYSEGTFGYAGLSGQLLSDEIVFWGRHGSDEGNRFFSWHLDLDGNTIHTGESSPYANYFQESYHIDAQGNLYIGDYNKQYIVTKYNVSGMFEWDYQKPLFDNPNGVDGLVRAIVTDSELNTYIGGLYYQDTIGKLIPIQSKIDQDGNLIWEHIFQLDTLSIASATTVEWLTQDRLLFTGAYPIDLINNTYQPYFNIYTPDGPYHSALSPLQGVRNWPREILIDSEYLYIGGTFDDGTSPSSKKGYFLAKYNLNTVGLQPLPTCSESRHLSISPNPFTTDFQVDCTAFAVYGPARLCVRSLDGRLVWEKHEVLYPGQKAIRIEVPAGVKPGGYLVSIEVAGDLYSGRIIKN